MNYRVLDHVGQVYVVTIDHFGVICNDVTSYLIVYHTFTSGGGQKGGEVATNGLDGHNTQRGGHSHWVVTHLGRFARQTITTSTICGQVSVHCTCGLGLRYTTEEEGNWVLPYCVFVTRDRFYAFHTSGHGQQDNAMFLINGRATMLDTILRRGLDVKICASRRGNYFFFVGVGNKLYGTRRREQTTVGTTCLFLSVYGVVGYCVVVVNYLDYVGQGRRNV